MGKQRVYMASDSNWAEQGRLVSERFQYDPYGQLAVAEEADAGSDSERHAWQCLHEGLCSDGDMALHHFRNRDYSPSLGRWVQQDPMGYVDGMSLYEYVKTNPATLRDALGLTPWLDGMMQRGHIVKTWLDPYVVKNHGEGWMIQQESIKTTVTAWQKGTKNKDIADNKMKQHKARVTYVVQGGAKAAKVDDDFGPLPPDTKTVWIKDLFDAHPIWVKGTASFDICKDGKMKHLKDVPFEGDIPMHTVLDAEMLNKKIEEARQSLLIPEFYAKYGKDATLVYASGGGVEQ